MESYFQSAERITKLEKLLKEKELEITKRREVLETLNSTLLAKKKEESKVDAIDQKLSQKTASFDKTITYYRTEIEKSQKKADFEIEALEAKFELAKKKIEEKCTQYRDYCLKAISLEEEKKDLVTKPLEKKKEELESSSSKSEDDDKILVRLKIEEQQLREKKHLEEQLFFRYEREMNEQKEKQRRLAQQQALELLRQSEREALELAKQEAILRRQEIEREEQEHKEKNRQRMEEQRRQEKHQEKERLQRREHRNHFLKQIYPSLSADATLIYQYLKSNETGPDYLYKEAETKETLESCEAFLLQYQKEYQSVLQFEQNDYLLLTQKERDVYDELNFLEKVKIASLKKTKRKEWLVKKE